MVAGVTPDCVYFGIPELLLEREAPAINAQTVLLGRFDGSHGEKICPSAARRARPDPCA
jgi:hypothetical protein